ncbi:MAG: hypothetical protein E6Q97_38475 [Desulfurellales bacterium]|nr:MAG: hypothetical protein E6Q97_38475 [Desulfurellales bacterium]
MISVPSLQKTYDEFWSDDDAIIKPQLTGLESDKERQEKLAAWATSLRIARETGDWSGILSGNGEPTRFRLRIIPGDVARKLFDYNSNDRLAEVNALLVRAALVEIVGAHGFPDFKPTKDPDYANLGPIAPVAVTNLLDAIDRSIVNELAARVVARMTLPPK